MPEKITFSTNIPVRLRLRYAEGKPSPSKFEVRGKPQMQYLFSTTDDKLFYVSEAVGNIFNDQIRSTGIQAGELIEIVKRDVPQPGGRKNVRWFLSRVGLTGEQGDGTFAVRRSSAQYPPEPADPEPPTPPPPAAADDAALMKQLEDSIMLIEARKLAKGRVAEPASELEKQLRDSLALLQAKKAKPKTNGANGLHPPAPPAAAQTTASETQQNHNTTAAHAPQRSATMLEDALCTVIAACVKARAFAKEQGYDLPAFNGDEHCRLVNTLMIGKQAAANGGHR